VSEYEGSVTFTEVNTEYDTSERRAVASGGSGVEWQNIMIGKVCTIENKVHDIQNNHTGHYQEGLKKLEKMDNNNKEDCSDVDAASQASESRRWGWRFK
jgi:hypothetical protein